MREERTRGVGMGWALRAVRAAAVLTAAAAACAGGGCGGGAGPRGEAAPISALPAGAGAGAGEAEAVERGPAWDVAGGPFAATAVRIHALTHVARDEAGNGRVVLHVEFTDRWGDAVKAVGRLRAQVYRGVGLTSEREPEAVWEVDLRDEALNAALYDPTTRTYRAVLGEAPGWLVSGSGEGPVGVAGTATLRVFFETAGEKGGRVPLSPAVFEVRFAARG